ncbi:MAG: hypothetical protein IKA36_04825, partial [Clostridia bacterium]|nr:hypothetical protein [Clostridia bacterium]
MSTSHRIHDVIYEYPMADVEEYFKHINNIIGLNSGTNDYQIVTHDCYGTTAPVYNGQTTKFRLTDSSLDIIDISQGYITLKARIGVQMKMICPKNPTLTDAEDEKKPYVTTVHRNGCWFFVGFKSASHIINSYTVYSNGQPTSCKQTKSVQEQTIVYNCKSKSEKNSRPGMYSPHKDVLNMRGCVCGTYIQQPMKMTSKSEGGVTVWRPTTNEHDSNTWNTDGQTTIDIEMCIQVDDLLPFSGMTYFPRFASGELELELNMNLEKNMVFCQVPYEEVLNNCIVPNTVEYENPFYSQSTTIEGVQKYTTNSVLPLMSEPNTIKKNRQLIVDSRFHQFGEYARCALGLSNVKNHLNIESLSGIDFGTDVISDVQECYVTFETCKLTTNPLKSGTGTGYYDKQIGKNGQQLEVYEAESHVFGFGIKNTAKENLLNEIRTNGLIIPAQWIEYHPTSQKPQTTSVRMNSVISLWEIGQLVFTFPTDKQCTVTRNPFLEDAKAQIGNRLIPDRGVSTNSAEYSEMCIS